MLHNIKDQLDNPLILRIFALSVFNNSLELAEKEIAQYRSRHNLSLYGWIENEEIIGVCGFRVYHTDRLEILNIAVDKTARKRGVGSAIIAALQKEFLLPIKAETDDEAVDFYRKAGFETTELQKHGIRRWVCTLPMPIIPERMQCMDVSKVSISYMPKITEEQLWEFYVRNDICEAGYGRELAVKPLRYNPYIVAAFYEDRLVGIIRAMFDGLSADIREVGLELALQGDNLIYSNGSLIEKDTYGIFKKMGLLLQDELQRLGNTFMTYYVVQNLEEAAFQSIGMVHNTGHLAYCKDTRNYVQ